MLDHQNLDHQNKDNRESRISPKEIIWLAMLIGCLGITLAVITATMAA